MLKDSLEQDPFMFSWIEIRGEKFRWHEYFSFYLLAFQLSRIPRAEETYLVNSPNERAEVLKPALGRHSRVRQSSKSRPRTNSGSWSEICKTFYKSLVNFAFLFEHLSHYRTLSSVCDRHIPHYRKRSQLHLGLHLALRDLSTEMEPLRVLYPEWSHITWLIRLNLSIWEESNNH